MAGKTKTKKSTKKVKATKSSKVAPKSKKTAKSTKEKDLDPKIKKKKSNQKFYDELKLSESYVSLVLGGAVVLGIFVIFFAYIHESKNAAVTQKVLHDSVTPIPVKTISGTIYIIKEDESLWDLAVRFYGDGFAYPRIVEANKGVITNPDYVPPGTKIIIPKAQ